MGWINKVLGKRKGSVSDQLDEDERRERQLLEEKKRDKEVMIARATVESYVKSILPAAGLAYSLRLVDKGVTLRIKMSNRRMIQIRLNRINYVKTLEKILPSILAIKEAFDTIGPMYVKVMPYYYAERWVEPEEIADENNE